MLKYWDYYTSLASHTTVQIEWLEEVFVRTLYRRSSRNAVGGGVLVDIPFGVPEDLQDEPRVRGWMKPFPMRAKRTVEGVPRTAERKW